MFITTGYKGAPYGLSIVNPAKAGPFDLGKVIVRATINVIRYTAALSIIERSVLPTILDGIPLQIQHVNVSVDREKFTFNPTNCNKTQIDRCALEQHRRRQYTRVHVVPGHQLRDLGVQTKAHRHHGRQNITGERG